MLGDQVKLAKRWRSEARVSLIFSAFIRTNERETATSIRTVVLANAAAGRDERHRLVTSAERRRNVGKDDRTMFDIVAMRQGKQGGEGGGEATAGKAVPSQSCNPPHGRHTKQRKTIILNIDPARPKASMSGYARWWQNFIPEGYGLSDYQGTLGLSFPSWPTTVRTMPTSRPKLLRGRDDMEEFHLRRREADGPNPRIPAVGAMVSGSLVHHQAAEIRRRKSVGSARRARIVKAARHERRDMSDTIQYLLSAISLAARRALLAAAARAQRSCLRARTDEHNINHENTIGTVNLAILV
ncbi:hypothetical protein THAOC_22379, partial [Thalassiosira oceanica]